MSRVLESHLPVETTQQGTTRPNESVTSFRLQRQITIGGDAIDRIVEEDNERFSINVHE